MERRTLTQSINRMCMHVVQLTPSRPPRPETEARLRPSGSHTTPEPTAPVVSRSPATRPPTIIAENDETPPPLPEKSTTLAEPQSDYANVGGSSDDRHETPPVMMRRTTHRGRVCSLLTTVPWYL